MAGLRSRSLRLSAAVIAFQSLISSKATANDDVLALAANPANNVMPSITYNGWNYSELDQINLANVANLEIAWTWQIGIVDQHEAPPLVVGGTMYIVSPKPNYVYALDLNRNGELLWEFRPDMDVELATPQTCCGGQTRGIYYAEGKLFYATLDGQVFGLDAATGEALWRTVGTNLSYGEGMASNGLVAGNLFIVGNEGGERGVRGKVHAYDINTGNLQWVMYNMGPDNEVGITPSYQAFYPDNQVSLATWYGDSWRRGGGTTWGYFTYDPDLEQFYYSTGNCGPWNPDYRREWGVVNLDENGGLVDYRNNWCASQIARDATTGNLAWAFNMTPADMWGLDEPAITPLVDLEIGGVIRQTAIKVARNGYFFLWDRSTGELAAEPWPHVFTNWATGFDMETGRALMNIDAWTFTDVEDRRRYTQIDPGNRAEGTQVVGYTGTEVVFCPGLNPRTSPADAYSPRTGLVYTSTSSGCGNGVVLEGQYIPGEDYTLRRDGILGQFPRLGLDGRPAAYPGELQAIDPRSGECVWGHGWTVANDTAILATATDLLFQIGADNGTMRALDANVGDVVWEFRTGASGTGTPITYLGPDGRQYVAIIASSGSANSVPIANGESDNVNRYRRSGSTLYTFALPFGPAETFYPTIPNPSFRLVSFDVGLANAPFSSECVPTIARPPVRGIDWAAILGGVSPPGEPGFGPSYNIASPMGGTGGLGGVIPPPTTGNTEDDVAALVARIESGPAPDWLKDILTSLEHRQYMVDCTPAAEAAAEAAADFRPGASRPNTYIEAIEAFDAACLQTAAEARETLGDVNILFLQSRVGVIVRGTLPICVATLVAADYILTAKHCLYEDYRETTRLIPFSELVFQSGASPGRSWELLPEVRLADGGANLVAPLDDNQTAADQVLIRINGQPLGPAVRMIEIAPPEQYDRLVIFGLQASVFLAAYERRRFGDPVAAINVENEGTGGWTRHVRLDLAQSCRVVVVVDNVCIYHSCQTEAAMSGAPLFRLSASGQLTLVGVHVRTWERSGGNGVQCYDPRYVTNAPNLGVMVASNLLPA